MEDRDIVNAIAVTGGNAADFSVAAADCVTASISVSRSCDVQVTFHPSAAGSRNASVVVTDTAPGSPHTLPLVGTGVATQPNSPPGPWLDQDVGSVRLPGSFSFANGVFTVKGSGADIWGTADAFNYLYQPISGNKSIVARILSVQNVNAWTKTGIMLRSTLDPSSNHVSIFVTPGKGIALQWRGVAGGLTKNIQVAGAAPRWLKLVRTDPSLNAGHDVDALGTRTTVPRGPRSRRSTLVSGRMRSWACPFRATTTPRRLPRRSIAS